jgi:hypothetical protein
MVGKKATTKTCLAFPAALANPPVPPVTVSMFNTGYRVYEDVIASIHTVPFNEVNNSLPLDVVAVFEPDTELLPEPQDGKGLVAICEPLVVP